MTVGLDDEAMQAAFDKLMRLRSVLYDITGSLPMLRGPANAARELDKDIIELWARLNPA